VERRRRRQEDPASQLLDGLWPYSGGLMWAWLDEAWEFIIKAPESFIIGGLIGWYLSSRYRIIRRRKEKTNDNDETRAGER
jgi:hypothetical protein